MDETSLAALRWSRSFGLNCVVRISLLCELVQSSVQYRLWQRWQSASIVSVVLAARTCCRTLDAFSRLSGSSRPKASLQAKRPARSTASSVLAR